MLPANKQNNQGIPYRDNKDQRILLSHWTRAFRAVFWEEFFQM